MQPPSDRYEPGWRLGHQTVVVENNVYMWAGWDGNPRPHDSKEKLDLLSCVEVFHTETGDWVCLPTTQVPPLGIFQYACTAVDKELFYFGGYCGHNNCFHNSLHTLTTSTLQWKMLSPTAQESGRPMGKSGCGMAAFRDGAEKLLYVVGGYGSIPFYHQPGAQYDAFTDHCVCNEHHMFSLTTREWTSPYIIGQPPPPCFQFTLTPVGERRAALFGGRSESVAINNVLIVDMSRDTVTWNSINKPSGVFNWPEWRYGHSTICVGPLLVIVGGSSDGVITNCWISNTNTMDSKWKELFLPDSVTKRYFHSLSALQLSSNSVLLVTFGGQKSWSLTSANTVLIELIQRDVGWSVRRVLKGTDLEYKILYQLMLSRTEDIYPLEEVLQQLQQERELIRVTEQNQKRLMVQVVQQAKEREQQLNLELLQSKQQIQQVTRENKQIQLESQQMIRDLRQQLSVAEGREEQPHWVVRREEIELTGEVLGKGSYGEVKVANFRGLRVAAKFLQNEISNYQLLTREMMFAAKIRHPNLLLFIGATREGEAVILTELMSTSLRNKLHKRDKPVMSQVQITSIAQDVACALRYLHQWRPSPIIHRDISSANVLLEPLPNGWRAKVSDYGTVNFMKDIATPGPGAPAYAAPEACYPAQHSPKMDTFSYGLLLVEICIRKFPVPAQREAQILQIQWADMETLVRQCTSERPADRPSMRVIMDYIKRPSSSQWVPL